MSFLGLDVPPMSFMTGGGGQTTGRNFIISHVVIWENEDFGGVFWSATGGQPQYCPVYKLLRV